MDVGMIGLGPMGSAMARSLMRAGHRVSVFNRSAAKIEALVRDGAVAAASPAVAANGDAVITMVANDAAVEAMVTGPDGLIAGMRTGCVHIAMSTMSVALADRLAEMHAAAGQAFLSVPVLGRPPAAEAGKLFLMAGGAADRIETLRPVFDALGQRLFVVGPRPGQANLIKLCANFLIFSTIEQLSEVFALAEKGGVAPSSVFEILTESFFSAPVHKNYGKLIVDKAFDPPGANVHLAAKDTRLVLQAAESLSVPLPFASILRDRFLATEARGEGELDFAVISRRAAEDAGL